MNCLWCGAETGGQLNDKPCCMVCYKSEAWKKPPKKKKGEVNGKEK